jgi:hypothetical protein
MEIIWFYLYIYIYIFFFFFWHSVLLCSPGWPWIWGLPASAYWMLGVHGVAHANKSFMTQNSSTSPIQTHLLNIAVMETTVILEELCKCLKGAKGESVYSYYWGNLLSFQIRWAGTHPVTWVCNGKSSYTEATRQCLNWTVLHVAPTLILWCLILASAGFWNILSSSQAPDLGD